MNKRLETVKHLVSLSKPLDELSEYLSEFSWDYEGKPLIVKSIDIINVLNRYICGDINADSVEQWANMLECREDIEFEEEKIECVVYSLANPELEGPNSIDYSKTLINKLSRNDLTDS
ncbi:hypothetical protein [Salinivibrio sp. ML290]|uniref:hypothetical protein n=1 Tax=Salinivibrio sp. ML290 TaxID=1909468 RepID=UPI0009887C2E|nr:hypothetical protein [Salinivibrio sp. ML290]OOE76077.1 hypothetical protein BZG23_05230 [Salinivibrio sp. ML290]